MPELADADRQRNDSVVPGTGSGPSNSSGSAQSCPEKWPISSAAPGDLLEVGVAVLGLELKLAPGVEVGDGKRARGGSHAVGCSRSGHGSQRANASGFSTAWLSSVNATKFRPLSDLQIDVSSRRWCLGCWRFRTLQEPRIGTVARGGSPGVAEHPCHHAHAVRRRDSCLREENGRGQPPAPGKPGDANEQQVDAVIVEVVGRRRSAPAPRKHANGNGNGNGHARHADGDGDGAAKRASPRSRAVADGDGDGDAEVLDGQPPIAALLGLARDGDPPARQEDAARRR